MWQDVLAPCPERLSLLSCKPRQHTDADDMSPCALVCWWTHTASFTASCTAGSIPGVIMIVNVLWWGSYALHGMYETFELTEGGRGSNEVTKDSTQHFHFVNWLKFQSGLFDPMHHLIGMSGDTPSKLPPLCSKTSAVELCAADSVAR